MWANIKRSGFKVNFSRRYYRRFILKPCARETCFFLFSFFNREHSSSPSWLLTGSRFPRLFCHWLAFSKWYREQNKATSFTAAGPMHGKHVPVFYIGQVEKLTKWINNWNKSPQLFSTVSGRERGLRPFYIRGQEHQEIRDSPLDTT